MFKYFQIFKKCSKYRSDEIIMRLGIGGVLCTDKPWWLGHKKVDSSSKDTYGILQFFC